ncbi:MAG: acyltransferase family protein [Actinomycetota bacterium]
MKPMRAADLAERTPASRERYVDFLRAFSILVVVLGHWFIALIYWEDGRIGVDNAIGVTRGLWLGTWLLQVIPLFFFVGGFSNAKTLEARRRRGEPLSAFWRTRTRRLLFPTAVFVAVWIPVQVALHLTGRGGEGLLRGGMLPFGPLWFLLVYLGIILMAPAMAELHRRFRLGALAAIVAAAVAVDLLRFAAGVPAVGWLNLGLVWLAAHQLGFFYADGSLPAVSRRLHAVMAIAGLGTLVVLTNIGVYPRSMIGTDVERISNMNPPTICILALTFWQVGLAMLLRERLSRWLARTRPWIAVVAANGLIMTVYLWHMTAYVLVILALYPLGLGRPEQSSAAWWIQRPLWLLAPGAVLALLIGVFGRFERPREPAAAA